MAPSSMGPPARGHARIAGGTPCGVFVERVRRPGTIWNLSIVGVYVVMAEPLPPVDTCRASARSSRVSVASDG